MIKQVADKFGKTPEEVFDLFGQASMNFGTLERFLETGDKTLLWNPLEDLVLKQNLPEDSPEYEYLISIKTWEQIEERIKFLKDKEENEDV